MGCDPTVECFSLVGECRPSACPDMARMLVFSLHSVTHFVFTAFYLDFCGLCFLVLLSVMILFFCHFLPKISYISCLTTPPTTTFQGLTCCILARGPYHSLRVHYIRSFLSLCVSPCLLGYLPHRGRICSSLYFQIGNWNI